jgi:phage tail sheath protein FI
MKPSFSAAGTTKGRLKNIVKFAWNPDKTARDLLYPNDINPVFSLPIAGPVLFGDKTILGKNTALSRVNVRRLLIILEKAIATAAVDLLFEFNDEFTQRRFVSMVDPLLKDAKGRRGLTAYKVIADSTVNTPQVIQNNGFVGQIYIKPNYTISDIRLDFIVVNASASFEEVIGSV